MEKPKKKVKKARVDEANVAVKTKTVKTLSTAKSPDGAHSNPPSQSKENASRNRNEGSCDNEPSSLRYRYNGLTQVRGQCLVRIVFLFEMEYKKENCTQRLWFEPFIV